MTTALGASRLRTLALVGVGGFAGAVLRWLLDGWFGTALGAAPETSLPVGTLAANVMAALVLGALLSASSPSGRVGRETRLLVGTGFCGSLSTYSAFAAETAARSPAVAGTYVVATYALGFAAVVAGDRVAGWAS